ncbi:MAG: hypothetical protein U1E65_06925 [Myxococcota bacterium]
MASPLIERSALAFAKTNSIAEIPPERRADTVQAVARDLGISEAAVKLALSVHWNETQGKQGTGVTGAAMLIPSSAAMRKGDSAGRPRMMQLENALSLKKPAPKDDVVQRADRLTKAIGGEEPTKVVDLAPTELRPELMRRSIALDEQVIQRGLYGEPDKKPRIGHYGMVQLMKLKDNDPLLDVPIYRGMGSQDPAVHALLVSGRLIPGGTGGDYEGFKTYSDRSPIDAFEWTLDPYVALKGAGLHGYLLQTSLRELRDAGKKDVARKVGDSEGGIFIAATIKPRVKAVGHGSHCYELGRTLPEPTHKNLENFVRSLQVRVPEAGGWSAFVDTDHQALKAITHVQAEETFKQISFLTRRIEELSPNDTLAPKARDQAAALNGKPTEERVREGRKILENLKQRLANLSAD